MKNKLKDFAKFAYGIVYALMLVGVALTFIGIIITLFTFCFHWIYLLYLFLFIAGTYICKIIYEKLFI